MEDTKNLKNINLDYSKNNDINPDIVDLNEANPEILSIYFIYFFSRY